MVAINEPIGGFVALANLEKGLFAQRSIEQEVANLVDLISIRIKEKSVEEVADSLFEKLFDLRIDLIKWLLESKKDLNYYLASLNKHITVNLQIAPYSDLAETISSVLLAYKKIITPLFESLPLSLEGFVESIQKGKLEYDTFNLFSIHPSPQIRSLKNWIDLSLQLDLGLILANLILTDQVQIPKKRIKSEIVEFLLSKITKFGAYSIFTGFWIPDADDHSILTNRMKIFSATLELDNKIFYRTSKEGLLKMVNN
ncbi:MAG TPA: hypothetical protein PKA00_16615 [Saprospiraceae bacterium]|nr:hypothetical protein [Saprospiraceae bacterium]HMQ84540.1 hypothetical protein [Saprospiraceae bacterium]